MGLEFMRRCKFCKSKLNDAVAVCQFCGDEEFIFVEEDEPVPTQILPPAPKIIAVNQDEGQQRNACCPNPDCAETIVPAHERYCPRCDRLLEIVSKDLWLTKIVKPEFSAHAAEILKDPLRLLTSAEEIGLELAEAEKALSIFFTELSGKNHHIVKRWVNSSVLPFFRMNILDESARRCAVTDAETEGIKTDFAEYAVEKLLSSGKQKADLFAEAKRSSTLESRQTDEPKKARQINIYQDTGSTKKRKFHWLFFWLR